MKPFQLAACAGLRQLEEAISPKHWAHLLSKAGAYLRSRGQYSLAKPLLVPALAIHEKQLGSEHPETANSLNDLANLYNDQGKYILAEPL